MAVGSGAISLKFDLLEWGEGHGFGAGTGGFEVCVQLGK